MNALDRRAAWEATKFVALLLAAMIAAFVGMVAVIVIAVVTWQTFVGLPAWAGWALLSIGIVGFAWIMVYRDIRDEEQEKTWLVDSHRVPDRHRPDDRVRDGVHPRALQPGRPPPPRPEYAAADGRLRNRWVYRRIGRVGSGVAVVRVGIVGMDRHRQRHRGGGRRTRGAMTGRRQQCRVRGCTGHGTCELPLPDDSTLDVLVCVRHAKAIKAEPGGWRLTSEPVDAYAVRGRIVIEPVSD